MANPKGFSLIEVVIATGLGAVVFSAALEMQSTALLSHLATTRNAEHATKLAYAVASLRACVTQASAITTPAVGATGIDLQGYINANPFNGSPIIAAQPATYFYFCQTTTPRRVLWKHSGAGWPMPPIVCGVTGAPEMIFSFDPAQFSVAFDFGHPAENLAEISYAAIPLSRRTNAISASTQIALQRGM